MDDNKNGTLGGFDKTENNGYTVTPEGSFYNKSREEIIQDSVFTEPELNSAPAAKFEPINSNKPHKRQKKYGAGVVILSSALAAVIGVVSTLAVGFWNGSDTTSPISSVTEDAVKNNVSINIDKTVESVVEAVYEKVAPSVVGIRTSTSVFNFFGGSSEATGEGSGVIYSSDGYIITNYHVISDAVENSAKSKIEVFVNSSNDEAYQASVVGYNISCDLAVIKIDAKNLVAVEVAKSSELKVGQYVITVGNPGGLEFMDSVSYGVVSGLNRMVSSDSEVKLIQTDAAINPGNSGGALVNTEGKLVGINSSKIVSEEYEGMGFAIPSDKTVEICNNIIARQNEPEPYVGISLSERYTAERLKYYGFPSGAVVLSVAEGSPANEAGIEKGDIITEFDGKVITDYNALENKINESTPGDTVTVKLYRSGKYYTTKLKIGSNS